MYIKTFKYCILIIHNTFLYRKRGEVVRNDFDLMYITRDPVKFISMYVTNVNSLANVIQDTWDSEWYVINFKFTKFHIF